MQRDSSTVSAYRRPLGYQQIASATLANATLLTLPTPPASFQVGYVVIQAEGSAATDYVRWRDDGTAPTASIGMRLVSGQELDYSGEMSKIQFIIGAGTVILNISYYY